MTVTLVGGNNVVVWDVANIIAALVLAAIVALSAWGIYRATR